MFYHVSILEKKQEDIWLRKVCEIDETSLNNIKKNIIEPYLAGNRVYIDGRFIDYKDIRELQVFESLKSAYILADEEQSKVPEYIIGLYYNPDCVVGEGYMKDITNSVLIK